MGDVLAGRADDGRIRRAAAIAVAGVSEPPVAGRLPGDNAR